MCKKKHGLEIKNFNIDNSSADLYIYGEITCSKYFNEEVTPLEICDFLTQVEGVKHLNLYINSPGGEVFAGVAIYNMLSRIDAEITCFIDGVAASTAAFLAMVADKIVMYENTFLMIHNPTMWMKGDSAALNKAADNLDKIRDVIINVFKTRFNISIKNIKKLMDNETFISAKDALKYGIIESVCELKKIEVVENKNKKIINGVEFDVEKYKNFPKNFGKNFGKEINTSTLKPKLKPENIDYSMCENNIKLTETLINL